MYAAQTKACSSDVVSERELAHRKLAGEVAAESIVLLKNEGLLPLEPCPLALYGAGAATTIKGGTGSGEVNERFSVSIEQGLEDAGFMITTKGWLRAYETLLSKQKALVYKEMAKRLLRFDANSRINLMATTFQYPPGRAITPQDVQESKQAKACNTALYVIARQAGECSDRSLDERGYALAEAEVAHLRVLTQAYERVLVALNASEPMDLSPLDTLGGIGALIFLCQQGMEGGTAFARIVTGETTPSGCLGFSWPNRYEDLPSALEYSYLKHTAEDRAGKRGALSRSPDRLKPNKLKASVPPQESDAKRPPHTQSPLDEEYTEGIYVGYRFFDSFDTPPRYEFGYGLSYTSFTLEHRNTAIEGTSVTLTAQVTNTGPTYPGKTCVQLYVSAPGGVLDRERQSLAAFAKSPLLPPGTSAELSLCFDLTTVAAYDETRSSFLLEEGVYTLHLGSSSRATTLVSALTLDETVVTEVCTPVCRLLNKPQEIKPNARPPLALPQNVQRLFITAEAFSTRRHSYQIPDPKLSQETEALLKSLELDDMIDLVVATGVMDARPHRCVPGAAAYTTSRLVQSGIPNVALCDGPAGVRVQKTSVRLKNGRIKPVETMMEFMAYLPWLLKKYMIGNPKKGTLLYQFATAFPVGTALAQTWNTELIEQVGSAMGSEMAEFGATYLLAPGMNIQRNPLCGRNYEYYSEDPLLSGKLAAALTRGVQSHRGRYATLKHFACNNQEDNRNYSNSVVSERALREIYLKGYRIAVEEAGAKAIMTSYNKLNGTYTPNSYDLCTTVLRGEWSFDGVVMTDWFSTGRGLASNGGALKAGNDLICPGGKAYKKALKRDRAKGAVSERNLRLSCARILKSIEEAESDSLCCP